MIKKKILVLGSVGMLGHQVVMELIKNPSFLVYDIARRPLREQTIILDIRSINEVISTITEIKPDVIINCIGLLIRSSTQRVLDAIFTNAYFPHILANCISVWGGKLIQISTDCVFSGKHGNYSEVAIPDGFDNYARTKTLGEIAYGQNLTIRTSIIGPELKSEGEGLFNWFINQHGQIKGFTNAMWTGVTTLELAKIIQSAIYQDIKGLYHITNGIPISKYHLLRLFQKTMKKDDVTIIPDEHKVINKSLISCRKDFLYEYPEYDEMVIELNDFILRNRSLYPHYCL